MVSYLPGSTAPYTYRETWTEVSLDSIYRNVQGFKSRLTGRCRLMAVVKADAYGHGAVETAKTAIKAGADYLGVAYLDEALQLRSAGIEDPIMILGYTSPRSVEAAVKEQIALTVFTEDVLEEAVLRAERLKRKAVIHLKIDTGMTRLGLTTTSEASALMRMAMQSPWVFVEGAFTHFASADHSDDAYVRRQFQAFGRILRELENEGLSVPIQHCCNSAATIRFPEMHLDMVRLGISMYGILPSGEIQSAGFPLEQAFQFKTRVSSLKRIPPDQPVGYGCAFEPARQSVIATIPVGYADGFPLSLSNRGTVMIRGMKTLVAGRVCMDQTMVDVTDVPGIQVGDEAVIFGAGEAGWVSVEEAAALMQTSAYEAVCSVGKRVPRLYVSCGKIVGVANPLLQDRLL